MAHQNVCRYFKFGYCKFLEQCRLMHISEKCTNPSCEIKTCNLRHPKVCKFYRDYRRCKFGEWCYFLHKENENIDNKTIEDLRVDMNEKRDVIEKKLKEIDEKIAIAEKQEIESIKKLENIFNEKIETFENTIKTLKKCIIEKDEYILSFETRLKLLEKKNIEVQKTDDSENTEKVTKNEIKCSSCDFTTTSKHGLKIHTQRMHTEQNFSKTCSLCGKTFKSKHKFRNHKFEHTNWERKNNSYSCKECDFVGYNMYTHEVHMGKAHSSSYECGLCDTELGNLGALELHLNTCEIYKCRYCHSKERNVSEIKKHAQTIHDGSTIIDHLKISRNNKEEVSETMYWDKEL